MRNYFPKRPSGAPLQTLSKFYDVPVGFVNSPVLGLCIALFAVAGWWLLLDVGLFLLLLIMIRRDRPGIFQSHLELLKVTWPDCEVAIIQ